MYLLMSFQNILVTQFLVTHFTDVQVLITVYA